VLYSLDALNGNEIWKRLLCVMISRIPEDRPTATAIRYYPAFWDSSLLLSFLQVFIFLFHYSNDISI